MVSHWEGRKDSEKSAWQNHELFNVLTLKKEKYKKRKIGHVSKIEYNSVGKACRDKSGKTRHTFRYS